MKTSSLGFVIRSLREQNHLTQAALARKVGVTDKAVSKWERGISYPDVSLFPKLADIFGVSAEELLRAGSDEGQPSRLVKIFEMSHDIRTPLHIILGCADMAETYCDDKDMLLRYLESIRISGEYLLQELEKAMHMTGSEDLKEDPDTSEKPDSDPAKTYPGTLYGLGEALQERAERRKRTKDTYDFTGKRFLVAEDMELNREIAREVLKPTGAEVEFAEDGEICVDMIRKAPAGWYNLILMDLSMPRMDGMEATRQIRNLEDREKASVPIIAMTANVYEKDRRAAMKAGMNAFTEKPIFTEKLFAAIAAHV